jgi:hypothetical protein
MTWLTWRQLRLQSTFVLAAVAALVLALVLTAHGLRSAYSADLATFLDQLHFHRFDTFLYLAGLVAVGSIAPIIGAFWAAPSSRVSSKRARTGWCGTRARPGNGGSP